MTEQHVFILALVALIGAFLLGVFYIGVRYGIGPRLRARLNDT